MINMSTKEVVRVFTIYLELNPTGNRGDLVVVPEYVNEDVYNTIKENLSSSSHQGKIELGFTGDDGIGIREVASDIGSLGSTFNNVLAMAKEIIKNGVDLDNDQEVKPRGDLAKAFNNLNVLWPKEAPQVKELSIISESHIYNYDDSLSPLTPAGIMVEKARLIPTGYRPEVIDKLKDKESE